MSRHSSLGIVPYIAFDRGAGASFYRQIYEGYRAAILEGRLGAGQRLPSTRALARELGISRLPVLNAFEQLLHEGYIDGRKGSGTYVQALTGKTPREERGGVSRRRVRKLEPQNPSTAYASPTDPGSILGPFRVSMPALDRFPRKLWARLVARHSRAMSIDAMAYAEPAGFMPLREAIAHYLRTARAVSCDARQVLIVPGSQMALQLCAFALLKRTDEVAIEDPGYPGARGALTITGATARPTPVDDDGLIVRALSTRKRSPRMVYVTPSHQYPLGVSMTASRRIELLDWARRNDAWVVEDDYDSEYRYASRPLGSLQGMDGTSRVIYVGTFSKVLFPALRVGYLVVPPPLVETFTRIRESFDLFSPTLYQSVLAEFLSDGHFARHVRRMRMVYEVRRNALVESIQRRLKDSLTIANAEAGLHLTAWLPDHCDDEAVVQRAATLRISATPLSSCYVGKPARRGLILGFGGATESQIDDAIEKLAPVIERACAPASLVSRR